MLNQAALIADEMAVPPHAVPAEQFRGTHDFVRAEIDRGIVIKARPDARPVLPAALAFRRVEVVVIGDHAFEIERAERLARRPRRGAVPEILRMPLIRVEAREAARAGLAVRDALDAAAMRLVEQIFEARDRAGILRLPGEKNLRVGRHLRVIARRPREALEVIRVVADVALHDLRGLLRGEFALVLSRRRAGDPDAINIAAHAKQLARRVNFAVLRFERAAQFAPELARAHGKLEGHALRLVLGERHARAKHLARLVRLGPLARDELKRTARGQAQQRRRGLRRFAGEIMHLVQAHRFHRRRGRAHLRELDAIAEHAQIERLERRRIRRALEQLRRLAVEQIVRAFAFGSAEVIDLQLLHHRRLVRRGFGAHFGETGFTRRVNRDREFPARMKHAQRERPITRGAIELKRVHRPCRRARLELHGQRVNHAHRHRLEPRRHDVIARGQIRLRREQRAARGELEQRAFLARRARVHEHAGLLALRVLGLD